MSTSVKLMGFVLALATACSAQDGLSVRNRTNQRWAEAEAHKIYLSACAVVQREFSHTLPLARKVTLVQGADKDESWFSGSEIRLTNGIVMPSLRGGLAGAGGFDAFAAKASHCC